MQGPDPDISAMVAPGSEGQGKVEQPAKDQGGDDDIGEGGEDQIGGDLGGEGDKGGVYSLGAGRETGQRCPGHPLDREEGRGGDVPLEGKNIQDIYLRYLDQGLLTVHVRATVNVSMKVIITYFVNNLAKNLKMEDALQAFEAGKLEVTFKAGRVDEKHLISSFPDRAMFMLCRGSISQEFKGHAGKVWQCSIYNHSDNKRTSILCLLNKEKVHLQKREEQVLIRRGPE